jgi:recombination protein RecR
MQYNPLEQLIKYFQRMPSVGAKSAQRMAFYILSQPESWVSGFAETLNDVKKKIKYCSQCYNITLTDPCAICASPDRDKTMLCVIADPKDQLTVEKIGEYNGVYHVLGGLISPIDGITPEILKITELVTRVKTGQFKEVFFAINPTIEGEATILYIINLLKGTTVNLTRIAYGLPIGADLDYTDELTLSKAYEGRVKI